MMTPLTLRSLEVDAAVMALLDTLGRTDRANLVRQRLKDLRLVTARLLLADLAAHPDQVEPADAVKLVIEAALAAGMEWPAIVAAVNSASEQRGAR